MTPLKKVAAGIGDERGREVCAGGSLAVSAAPTAVTTIAESAAQTIIVTAIRLSLTARA